MRSSKFLATICLVLASSLLLLTAVQAEDLNSNNYKIVDPTVGSGGGPSDSASGNYSMLGSNANPSADARLASTNYRIGSGFPNGIQANVPTIRCAVASATSNSGCQADSVHGLVMNHICGAPGCFDRAKVEVNPQGNPIDTLYLVMITTGADTYYLQSDHTIATTYDIGDYMTICELEGYDPADSACNDNLDGNWNGDLQQTNVYGLAAGTAYTVYARALHGDFTESSYTATGSNFTTVYPTLIMDLDIGPEGNSVIETTAPYQIALGTLSTVTPNLATNRIWGDLGTNIPAGFTQYVYDSNAGLNNGITTITSESENLLTDPNNNGGYGIAVESSGGLQGPLKRDALYDTNNYDIVGALSTTPQRLLYTVNSGGDRGILYGGRFSLRVVARARTTTASGSYSDTITFIMIGNV